MRSARFPCSDLVQRLPAKFVSCFVKGRTIILNMSCSERNASFSVRRTNCRIVGVSSNMFNIWDCSISGLLADRWTFASSLRPYERCEGSSSFAERYVSHISLPATTDHSAQFEPPNADELFESFGIFLIRIRPIFDQCATLQTESRWSSTAKSYAAMLWPTRTSASMLCSFEIR